MNSQNFLCKSDYSQILAQDVFSVNPNNFLQKNIKKCLLINREVITIRGILAGQYQVAAHVYSMRPKNDTLKDIPQVIRFKLIKINPYKEQIILEKFYNMRGQVISLANFWVDEDGKFVKYNTLENNIVTRRNNSRGL